VNDDIFEVEQPEASDRRVKSLRRARKHVAAAAQAKGKAPKMKGRHADVKLEAEPQKGKATPKSTPAAQTRSPEPTSKAKSIAPEVEQRPWLDSRVHEHWKSTTWRRDVPLTQFTSTSSLAVQLSSAKATTNGEPIADRSRKWANFVLKRPISPTTTLRRTAASPTLFPAATPAQPKKPAEPVEVETWWDEL
jgi:hypothetical protein